MAASVNRSPSPISTRPNPNSRTPEANSTMRRSYSGNPFTKPSNLSNPRSFPPVTPANSPAADLGGRHSISKEIGFSSRAYEEKENEKDQNLKPVKVRSPAILKGAKNFMTPTISAASKVTASPKKKVLVERNEPARTSISFSDGNSPFGSMNNSNFKEDVDAKDSTIKQKDESLISQVPLHSQNFSESYTNMKSVESDVGFNQNKAEDSNNSAIRKSKKVSFVDSQAPLNSQIFSESIFDVKPVESDLTSVDNDCKIKPFGSSISPIIAPLDADPSRPYDPKTNYLSPRPQFLHYKPNPRIEVYLHKEKGIGSTEQGKILEESFISESFSDTEVTSEEIESENSNKESEDDSSVEFVNEEVDPHVSELKPTNICKETVEDKGVLKTRCFKRSKSVALILVLLIAFLSVSVKESPVLDLSSYKDLSISKFYDPSEIAGFSKASFNGFARTLKQWSANSAFYLSKLISSLDEVHRLGPLQFRNLTSLLEEDPFIDGYLKVDHSDVINEEIDAQEEEVAVELLLEETLDNGAPDEDADDNEEALEGLDIEKEHLTLETEENESDCSELGVNQEQSDVPSLPSNGPESDCSELGVNQEQIDTPSLPSNGPESDCSELGVNQEQIDIPSLPSNGPEFEPEVVETHEINSEIVDTGEVQDAKIESTAAEAISKSHLEMDTPLGNVASSESVVNWSEIKFFVHHKQTIATLALGLALVAAAIAIAVVYLKPREITTPSAAVIDPLMTKKQIISTPPSQIWPADVDVVGESCPSEMSSFQKSVSYSKRVQMGESEIQSQEKKQRKTSKRRESLASSSDYSMGSPSYGSFTTYEKIPAKHASGEEEIVTPVRRSSRFKNQVTSP